MDYMLNNVMEQFLLFPGVIWYCGHVMPLQLGDACLSIYE